MNDVQQRELAVYNEIAKVCNRHNLLYFAIGGTCIGAVRHKGFIPWDDDIDIALPRKHYELFRTQYYKELPGYLHLLDYDNSKQHTFLFSKIHDSRTTYIERYAEGSTERYTGAFVDLMPVDGLPQNSHDQDMVYRTLKRLNIANDKSRPVPLAGYHGSFLGPLKWMGRKLFSCFHPYNYYSSKVKDICEEYDFFSSDMCIFTWRAGSPKCGIDRVIFPRIYFEDLIDVPFEDSIMRIPSLYDKYLRQDFGDYMKLPPVDQQQTHHVIYISDMNTPCEYYAKRDSRKNKCGV